MNLGLDGVDLREAVQHLQRGDIAEAESLLMRLAAAAPDAPEVLRLLGFLRYRQGRLDDAAAVLTKSLTLLPGQPDAQLNLGHVRRGQGKPAEALAAFRAAAALKPDLADAHCEIASLLQDAAQPGEAEQSYRRALTLSPHHAKATLGLGALLIDVGRPAEAEKLAQDALARGPDKKLAARLEAMRGAAQGALGRSPEALQSFERARTADPNYVQMDHRRACLMADLGRFDQAVDVFREVLARQPLNLEVHRDYNNLLYCLGRDTEFLQSYDRAAALAPDQWQLPFAKASFLMFGRLEEAHQTYRQILARDPGNLDARLGAAQALAQMKKPQEALEIFEDAVRLHPDRSDLVNDIAALHLQMGEPAKAVAMAEARLAVQPEDQFCLALLGTAWRLMDDERGEWLNGYDRLIGVFDLEPPQGFSDMATFNAELDATLDRLHPMQREFIGQSLRGGTQTTSNIFTGDHDLVNRLKRRIDEAVARYIAAMDSDERHPFLARRGRDFSYSGAWSSRLRDEGFHVNHVHPLGWISSCYYVAVPDAASDRQSRQGWLKFGEPRFDVGLAEPIARAVQPKPGRLVLFPSYTWHGTIPFRDQASRTTIAFDVVPV